MSAEIKAAGDLHCPNEIKGSYFCEYCDKKRGGAEVPVCQKCGTLTKADIEEWRRKGWEDEK